MSHALSELALQLERAGKPFVIATVVWCERPTSAKPGARAIIQSDGQITGWIGGSCTQPVAIREARRILREGGDPFLLRLGAPERNLVSSSSSGVRAFPMTCASGGALDIYMEPHLPQLQLLLIGDSPIIAALEQFAPLLDFAVTSVDDSSLSQAKISERTYIVIATHGQYDENVLEQVLKSSAAYIGMVSSPRRAAACCDYLREVGLEEQQIARLKAPAGLNISAVTPTEIAASIMAELVQVRRGDKPAGTNGSDDSDSLPVVPQPEPLQTAIDPVCGMTVEVANARHKSIYEGHEFFFCCPACKREFERQPQDFLVAHEKE